MLKALPPKKKTRALVAKSGYHVTQKQLNRITNFVTKYHGDGDVIDHKWIRYTLVMD